jgi:hypothetical protein
VIERHGRVIADGLIGPEELVELDERFELGWDRE